ncbi:hypothetical protein BIW11_08193 [Tropilaelaps mercedesae]|uniref:Uncharacterized protein n=1 Tax=Tropilaelaps mercedesae TaxID=418985 RepID=A0A1V9XQL8_9ACAR|nr:hypothetical protein BIW11_08193 [Tropilaelaps mercedesae]
MATRGPRDSGFSRSSKTAEAVECRTMVDDVVAPPSSSTAAQKVLGQFPVPSQPLTIDSLIKFVAQSSYLYDSTNPLFASARIRIARWHEIGAFFDTTGEIVARHWLKAVSRYKYVLRKLLVAKLRNEPIQVPGPWFDKVGAIIGVTFEQAQEQLDPGEGLEDCLHRVLMPSRNLIRKAECHPTADDSHMKSPERKRSKRPYDGAV